VAAVAVIPKMKRLAFCCQYAGCFVELILLSLRVRDLQLGQSMKRLRATGSSWLTVFICAVPQLDYHDIAIL